MARYLKWMDKDWNHSWTAHFLWYLFFSLICLLWELSPIVFSFLLFYFLCFIFVVLRFDYVYNFSNYLNGKWWYYVILIVDSFIFLQQLIPYKKSMENFVKKLHPHFPSLSLYSLVKIYKAWVEEWGHWWLTVSLKMFIGLLKLNFS